MRIGFAFPVMEVFDPAAIRDVAQAGEDLGFSHMVVWEQVLGVDPANHPSWQGMRTLVPIHEPLVLLSHVAAFTRRLELVTGVLVLPQRQTGVVAKQVAELDLLSGGRVRLGVGVGWVEPQLTALGYEWADRGARADEQIDLLRAFFGAEVVTFHGRWHDVEALGICPRPANPVPIWVGGNAAPALRRAATRADGWMILSTLPEAIEADTVGRLHAALREAGRDLTGYEVETTVNLSGSLHVHADAPRSPDDVRAEVHGWAALGVTHVNLNTQDVGLSADGHIAELGRLWEALEDVAEG